MRQQSNNGVNREKQEPSRKYKNIYFVLFIYFVYFVVSFVQIISVLNCNPGSCAVRTSYY
jgi:hypothetical protein